MKKFLALSLALAVMLLAGCQAKDFSLTDGRYVSRRERGRTALLSRTCL